MIGEIARAAGTNVRLARVIATTPADPNAASERIVSIGEAARDAKPSAVVNPDRATGPDVAATDLLSPPDVAHAEIG